MPDQTEQVKNLEENKAVEKPGVKIDVDVAQTPSFQAGEAIAGDLKEFLEGLARHEFGDMLGDVLFGKAAPAGGAPPDRIRLDEIKLNLKFDASGHITVKLISGIEVGAGSFIELTFRRGH